MLEMSHNLSNSILYMRPITVSVPLSPYVTVTVLTFKYFCYISCLGPGFLPHFLGKEYLHVGSWQDSSVMKKVFLITWDIHMRTLKTPDVKPVARSSSDDLS